MTKSKNTPSWQKLQRKLFSLFEGIRFSSSITALFSSTLLAFGLYNVHSFSGVTEGGILGLTLLLEHWFKISPAVSGFVLNFLCYALGWKLLGRHFLVYSMIASVGFSVSYGIFEQIGPLFPELQKCRLWRP